MDEFCRHKDAASFDSSSIINSGSTDRLHNVLRTAMAGRPVSIGIIGGSGKYFDLIFYLFLIFSLFMSRYRRQPDHAIW